MRFDELDLEDAVLDGLYDMNFDETTPVQELTIPVILEGKDIIACAQTGTGKTAAYVLPVINELSKGCHPTDAVNAVIMAPTRELAQQIDQQIQGFTYFIPSVSAVAVYGGTDGIAWEHEAILHGIPPLPPLLRTEPCISPLPSAPTAEKPWIRKLPSCVPWKPSAGRL